MKLDVDVDDDDAMEKEGGKWGRVTGEDRVAAGWSRLPVSAAVQSVQQVVSRHNT